MLNPRLDRRVPTRRALFGLAVAVALLLLPVALLRAAQSARQPLDGVVYDTTGAVLPGIAVTLDEGPAKVEVQTDPSGRFRFDGVEPGSHVLQVAVPGFRALRQPIDAAHRRRLEPRRHAAGRRPAGNRLRARTAAGVDHAARRRRVGPDARPRRRQHPGAAQDSSTSIPVYPKRMVEAGLEGKVSVEAVVGVDGRVARARAADRARPTPTSPRRRSMRCGSGGSSRPC